MHHGATGELIEDAIRLLSLLETFSDVDDETPVHGKTVATAASTIVKILCRARQHHREVLEA
jgi:hypothetical protein